MPLPDWTIVGRLSLALAVGMVLGLERELKGHEAGLRTHILVSLGACLFTLAGTYGFPVQTLGPLSPAARVDVSRVGSQIVVGIGFIGGGTILRQGGSIRGLTTAADLWIAAALGLACAVGFYVAVITTVVLALASLLLFKPLEAQLARWGKKLRGGQPPDADV